MGSHRFLVITSLTLLIVFMFTFVSPPTYGKSIFDEMTKQQQEETGIDQLNECEKRALYDWILEHFIPKKERKRDKKSVLHLIMNINNGQRLRLSDGNFYDIEPLDTIYSSVWIVPSEIDIKQSEDPNYPLTLINLTSMTSVKAKKVSDEEAQKQKQDFNKKLEQQRMVKPEETKSEEQKKKIPPSKPFDKTSPPQATPPQPKKAAPSQGPRIQSPPSIPPVQMSPPPPPKDSNLTKPKAGSSNQ